MNTQLWLAVLWPAAILGAILAWRHTRYTVSMRRRLHLIGHELEPARFPVAKQLKISPKESLRERLMGPGAAALLARMQENALSRIASFGIAFLFGFVIRGWALGVVLGAMGLTGTMLYFRIKHQRWLAQIEASLPEFFRAVANTLRAGSSLSQAMAVVAQETLGPLGEEIRRVLRQESLGFPLSDALDEMTQRVPSRDLALAVMAISIQREVGGSLAELLDNIVQTVVERQRLKAEVRVITAQGRFSGWVLTALPVGLGAILWVSSPTYFQPMFHSTLGWMMAGAAALSVTVGAVVINRMARAPEL